MTPIELDLLWAVVGFLTGFFFGFTGSISLVAWVSTSLFYEVLQKAITDTQLYKRIQKRTNIHIINPNEKMDEKIFDTLVRYVGYVMGHYVKRGRYVLI